MIGTAVVLTWAFIAAGVIRWLERREYSARPEMGPETEGENG